MKNRLIFIIIICLFFSTLYSFAFWDSIIPESKKAEILYSFLLKEYKTDIKEEDVNDLKIIKFYLNWVILLDRSKKEDVKNLKENIKKDINNIVENNLEKARSYIKKKFYISAAMQYVKIKAMVFYSKEANDYLKKYKKDIKKYAKNKKNEAKKLIKNKDYLLAEKELKRVIKLYSNETETKFFLTLCDKRKKKEFKKIIKEAKKYFFEKNYNKAIKKAELALSFNPTSEEAKRIISESYKITKTCSKKTKKRKDLDQNNIRTINNTKVIIKDLMKEAVFNYNSQKYDKALKIFNEILGIQPDNEIAQDYKSRIEKRMKAFE